VYGRPAQNLSRLLAALQDVLGDYQDAIVATETLETLARTTRRLPPETLLAMGAIGERYRVQAAELRGQFADAFEALRGDPWREMRRAMEALDEA
jgi:CHAD domain-containing protein